MSKEQSTTELIRTIAKVERTFLGFEDHGILTAFLHVSYGTGGGGQGIGGFDLRVRGGRFLERLLKACGVDSWEQLKGRTFYALAESYGDVVRGVEPLPTERGERFIFADLWAEDAS